jgi:hypothetical protein
MKYYSFLVVALLSSIFFFSCSNEKLITEIGSGKNITAATYDGNAHLAKFSFPDGAVLSTDKYFEVNGNYISNNKISKIKPYLQYLFVIIPDDYKVIVINKTTFKFVAEYVFSDKSEKPKDIAFANATEAYLIMEETNKIYLIDTYYHKIAKQIDLKNYPSSVYVLGNKVFFTIPLDNTVEVFDTPSHSFIKTINNVGEMPYLIYKNADGSKLIVISAGMGKVPGDFRDAISLPQVSLINSNDYTVISTNDINPPKAELMNQLPFDFIVTNKDWGFFISQDYLIRVDLEQPIYSIQIANKPFKSLYYNQIYNELYYLESGELISSVYYADPVLAKTKEKLNYQGIITSFIFY